MLPHIVALSSRNFQTKAEGVRFSRWRNVCVLIDGLVASSESDFDLTKIEGICEALKAVDEKLDELRGYRDGRNHKRHRFSASTVYNEIRRERKRRREEEEASA